MQNVEPPSLLKLFHIPDLATISGLVSGALAVHFVLVEKNISAGMFALFLSSIFDLLDGWIAIKMGLQRKFGECLDFMVDTVVHIGFISVVCYALGVTQWWLLLGFMLSGCVRHARQLAYPNIKRRGISTTTAAGVIPAVVLFCQLTGASTALYVGISLAILSVGMLSTFSTSFYDEIKGKI